MSYMRNHQTTTQGFSTSSNHNNTVSIETLSNNSTTNQQNNNDARSSVSSSNNNNNRSSRSSAVLTRARAYNRIIDENRSRSRSRSRTRTRNSSNNNNSNDSRSNNGISEGGSSNRFSDEVALKEKAMASVRSSAAISSTSQTFSSEKRHSPRVSSSGHSNSGGHSELREARRAAQDALRPISSPQDNPSHSKPSSNNSNHQQQRSSSTKGVADRIKNNTPVHQQHRYQNSSSSSNNKEKNNANNPSSPTHSQSHNNRSSSSAGPRQSPRRVGGTTPTSAIQTENNRNTPSASANDDNAAGNAVVTPDLLVNALSGHEDGLLAIAERLMEHYDSGYDVMGESIIDAFADVQKLFQHVVEAAHMEGAAYENARREDEVERLKDLVKRNDLAVDDTADNYLESDKEKPSTSPDGHHHSSQRHEELIDQEVKDVIRAAIQKGNELIGRKRIPTTTESDTTKNNNNIDLRKHKEVHQIYTDACNNASALLPVDSDHRGRMQLSIARAEGMSDDRAIAILRYVMDDVLRSGGITGKGNSIDGAGGGPGGTGKRKDCVLARPTPRSRSDNLHSDDNSASCSNHEPTNGSMSSSPAAELISSGGVDGGVSATIRQSADEVLANLVEEMKEVLSAPIYSDAKPLQDVGKRFWEALDEAQKGYGRTEENLEQRLGQLKAEFLIARMVRNAASWMCAYRCMLYSLFSIL